VAGEQRKYVRTNIRYTQVPFPYFKSWKLGKVGPWPWHSLSSPPVFMDRPIGIELSYGTQSSRRMWFVVVGNYSSKAGDSHLKSPFKHFFQLWRSGELDAVTIPGPVRYLSFIQAGQGTKLICSTQ